MELVAVAALALVLIGVAPLALVQTPRARRKSFNPMMLKPFRSSILNCSRNGENA